MKKEEINKKIFELNSDEEIINFINERLKELEDASEEKIVGQNYTDSFSDYISTKIHYKAAERFRDDECPDLVYDDITPYYELIKSIRQNSWYEELSLFTTIFFVIYNYLPSEEEIGLGRYFTYVSHKGKKLSIKEISKNGVAFCSEKAGLAHNMFKFLGIDSDVICGSRDKEMHAYNMIYPNGYGNEPMVIYDPSYFINFVKKNHKLSFGFFKALKKEEYESFISGLPIKIDLTKTEKNYRNLYGSALDEYVMERQEPTYVFGLENAKKFKEGENSQR